MPHRIEIAKVKLCPHEQKRIGFVWYYAVVAVDEAAMKQCAKVRKAKLHPTRTEEIWLCSVFSQ
jgi:hypothetical protein